MEVARELVGRALHRPVRDADAAPLARRLVGVADRRAGSRSSSARWPPPPTRSPSTPSTRPGTTARRRWSSKPWAPNRHKIADLLDALAAVVHPPERPVDAVLARRARVRRAARLLRERAARRRQPRAARRTRPRSSTRPASRSPYDPTAGRRHAGSASSTSSGPTTATRSPPLQEWFGYVDLRPARPAQDPAAGRADPRRQGRHRSHPRRAGRRRERRRPDALVA